MIDDLYQEFIYKRSYSRWIDKEKRRESWEETVERYRKFFEVKVPEAFRNHFNSAVDDVRDKQIMPSMRALWAAGEALERESLCGYNCSYLVIDSLKSFADMMYILMCGCGVGFSVERQYINKLPSVPDKFEDSDEVVLFKDSKRGWAEGFLKYLKYLFSGKIPKIDISKIRPKGARLKVFGGRASGPDPLVELIEFSRKLIVANSGRKLSSINCYDIACHIASIVVVGGTRRSACISLSNLSDDRMAKAKNGAFWNDNPQRSLSNNSVAYTEKPEVTRFINEWLSLIESKTGERGIFNREAAKYIVSRTGRRDIGFDFGVNPCGEIILRNSECCNLSEIIIRENDTLKTLKEKARNATILGCVQSTLTKFNFISQDWKRNCEEERLLGVSLSGLADHNILNKMSPEAKKWLHELKEEVIETAKQWATILNINVPTATTCVKPSGTVSQLVGCSSGIHPRYAKYYIRRVRVSTTDPIAKFIMDKGVPYKTEVGQSEDNRSVVVFEFPIKSPENALFKDDITALQQLEYWKMIRDYWCEHNPSCTIYVKDNEWIEVAAWVYKHWNVVCGLSFLPYDTGIYKLAPYEEIDEETYNSIVETFPKDINFDDISEYETEDQTEGSKEFACIGDKCEI